MLRSRVGPISRKGSAQPETIVTGPFYRATICVGETCQFQTSNDTRLGRGDRSRSWAQPRRIGLVGSVDKGLLGGARAVIRVPVPNYPYAENLVERIKLVGGERVTVETWSMDDDEATTLMTKLRRFGAQGSARAAPPPG